VPNQGEFILFYFIIKFQRVNGVSKYKMYAGVNKWANEGPRIWWWEI
jgi:hypothetical protein